MASPVILLAVTPKTADPLGVISVLFNSESCANAIAILAWRLQEPESGLRFFVFQPIEHRCGTTTPCTSQAQAKTSLCTAQEGSTTIECNTTDASQAAAEERARTHGVVLISIAALFGVPRLRGLGSARHDRRLKAELRAVAPRRAHRGNFSSGRGGRRAGDRLAGEIADFADHM